jgi:hypothetical protein
MKKSNKLAVTFAIMMIVTTFLPWYSAQGISISGIMTLMGFTCFLIAIGCLVLTLIKKKIITMILGVIGVLVSLISLALNAAIWGQMAEKINDYIHPDQWSKYLSFGGGLYLLIALAFSISTIINRKKV